MGKMADAAVMKLITPLMGLPKDLNVSRNMTSVVHIQLFSLFYGRIAMKVKFAKTT